MYATLVLQFIEMSQFFSLYMLTKILVVHVHNLYADLIPPLILPLSHLDGHTGNSQH